MSTTTDKQATAAPAKEEKTVPQLGALEEDDEFEEFPVQGKSVAFHDFAWFLPNLTAEMSCV